MNVLVIDKNLVDPMHRAKWRALARRPGISLRGISPAEWVENSRRSRFESSVEDGFPITPLPVGWAGRENRGFYRSGLGNAVRDAKPDVVIAFEEPCSLFAWQAHAALSRMRPQPKLVVYSWDNLSDRRRFTYRPSWFYRAIDRRVVRSASQVWCANREAYESFERAAPGKARRLDFGLDLARFESESRAPHAGGGPFIVGYVGRLLAMKGVDTLIEALASCPTDVALAIVGSGPNRARLERLAGGLGVAERVSFREAVPSHEVPRMMHSLDALVLPSCTTPLWKEQFGRVLVEAMASGVPVIGSSSGAIPEVIGEAGLVFPEGDAGALAAKITLLRGDRDRREELVRLGRARAREFSAERFAERVEELLRAIP